VLATAGAGIAHYADAPSVLAFAVAAVALAALASIVSFATEEIGASFGPAVTGSCSRRSALGVVGWRASHRARRRP
jgi:hypothetical protein